ncbi:MAG: hypothetical protein ACRD6N_01915, partial [Pyrinomonadaceae bacterium]
MKVSPFKSTLLTAASLAMMFVFAFPITGSAQGRRRGRDRDFFRDKKCEKFINCHDARDGRWDGRGPRRNSRARGFFDDDRFSRRWRNFDDDRFSRRWRNDDRIWIRDRDLN